MVRTAPATPPLVANIETVDDRAIDVVRYESSADVKKWPQSWQ
jgi:hypothetical protein